MLGQLSRHFVVGHGIFYILSFFLTVVGLGCDVLCLVRCHRYCNFLFLNCRPEIAFIKQVCFQRTTFTFQKCELDNAFTRVLRAIRDAHCGEWAIRRVRGPPNNHRENDDDNKKL